MPKAPYPLRPQLMKRSWLETHPRWKIPLGFVILLFLIGVVGTAVVSVAMASIHHSEVYKQAIARASQNTEVRSQIGEPIAVGWFISGELHVNGSAGNANLSIPISGSKGKGTIRLVAFKSGGVWRFSWLQVEVAGAANSINLLLLSPPQ